MTAVPAIFTDPVDSLTTKAELIRVMEEFIVISGYTIEELTTDKPWGGGFRFKGSDADKFLHEFFPALNPLEVRAGMQNAELSPKVLLVLPGHRLSWQDHNLRTEVWKFLTPGAYKKSLNDEEGDVTLVTAGNIVSFSQHERHRLIGAPDGYTLVAEIWQHTDPKQLSSEDDIIRLQDDYKRV